MPHRRWTLKLIACATGLLLALAGIGVAWAYWSSQGAGTATASAATFNPPTNVTASSTPGSGSVAVGWSAASLSTGGAPSGYYVTRIGNAGSAPACASGPGTLLTSTLCTDTQVADGSYSYQVTAVYHSWTAVSDPSGSVSVTNTRPSVTVEQAGVQGDPARGLPISFTATFSEAVADFTGSAVTIGGTAPGTPSVTVTGGGTSYTIAVSGLTGSGTVTAAIAANAVHNAGGAGNTASTSTDNTVSYDPLPPTVAAPAISAAVTFGSNPVFVSNEPVSFTSTAADADSGINSVSYYLCAVSAGNCGSGTGTLLGSSSTATGGYPVTSSALTASGAYQVVAVARDNAGNSSISAATLLTVDTTPPTVSRPTVNGHS